MCLATTWKRAKRADKDITVYKILYNNKRSIYITFQYELLKLYKTNMKESDNDSCFDSEDVIAVNRSRNYCKEIVYKYIGQGFHSALKKDRFSLNDNENKRMAIYVCVIPKGSLYYMGNPSGLVVSNQIIVKRKALI